MLSVLIPTYNNDVQKLVKSIHKQLIVNNINFEIIIFEDGSTTSSINSNILLSHTKYILNAENVGRVKARQSLAEIAIYDWLLFLDADVIPRAFIKKHHDYKKIASRYLETWINN